MRAKVLRGPDCWDITGPVISELLHQADDLNGHYCLVQLDGGAETYMKLGEEWIGLSYVAPNDKRLLAKITKKE